MARPCKSAKLLTECSQTKDEIAAREKTESSLRGNAAAVRAPSYLTERQKKIFRKVKDLLSAAEVLGEGDEHIISRFAVAAERLEYIEDQINKNPNLLLEQKLMTAKGRYTQDFYRACNELSMSPQSRAKMGNLLLAKKSDEADPLLAALAVDTGRENG